MALVPEGRNIFGSLTVMENLRLGATIRRDGEVQPTSTVLPPFRSLVSAASSLLASSPAASSRCWLIARAMLSRPRLLMLDEPSLGLAPAIVDQVCVLLRSIREQGVVPSWSSSRMPPGGIYTDRRLYHEPWRFHRHRHACRDRARDGGFDAAYFGVTMAGASA